MAARALACAAGALPVLTFPAPSLWWLAYVALVPAPARGQKRPHGPARRCSEAGSAAPASSSPCTTGCCPTCMCSCSVVAVCWARRGRRGPGWCARLLAPAAGRRPRRRRGAPGALRLADDRAASAPGRAWAGRGACWGPASGRSPAALRLASLGGVWLVSLAGGGRRTSRSWPCWSVATPLGRGRGSGRGRRPARRGADVGRGLAGRPAATRDGPATRCAPRVVQPGVVGGPERRFAAEERLTRSARRPASRPGRVGREQCRLRPRRHARTGRPPRRPAPAGRGRPAGQRRRPPRRPARHLQERRARRPRRARRRPLRQDAPGAVRRVHPAPPAARLGHLGRPRRPAEDRRRGSRQVVLDAGRGCVSAPWSASSPRSRT